MSGFDSDLDRAHARARVAEIPASAADGLHQMGSRPFGALMDKLGITDEDLAKVRSEPKCEGEEFMAHRTFESQEMADGAPRYADPTDCEGTLRIQNDSGDVWPLMCDRCGFEVAVPIGRVDPGRLLERRLEKAGIPALFKGKGFEKGDPLQEPTLQACRMWLRQFDARRLGQAIPAVALYGKAGRGKSHLLSLMVETVIRTNGVDAVFVSAVEFFDRLREGFDEGTFEVRWQRVLRASVLAIDDLGAGKQSAWEEERLLALVDYRTTKQLPLLIATNVPPAGWESRFGDRVRSRLRGLCLPFELEGADRRAQGTQGSFMDAAA